MSWNSAELSFYFFKFNIKLAVDGIILPMVFLNCIGFHDGSIGFGYIKKRWKTYSFYLLLEVGMFGVFMAQDLFLFFLFFEITLSSDVLLNWNMGLS